MSWTYWAGNIPVHAAPKEKPEQKRERKRKERLAKLKARRRVNRSLILLDTLIGRGQRRVYERTGRILVKGKEFDYLLYKEGDVRRVEKDKIVDLCVHIKDKFRYPEADNLVALILTIRANEKHFNKLANLKRTVDRRADSIPEAANG
jgi:hypothetical protein